MKMSRKRKRTLAFFSVTVVFLEIIMSIFMLNMTGFDTYESRITVDRERGELHMSSDDARILQLSDVQTANLIECSIAYPTVKEVIRAANADLIVLTGDNISDGSGQIVLDTFIRFMDSFELPWALVFGNHDRNSDVPMEEISAALEKSEYCIFKTGALTDRYGNYSYKLMKDGEPVYQLVFMDSAKSGFTEEQVAWYENEVSTLTEETGRVVPGFAFFHIPIPETDAALKAYASGDATGSGRQVEEADVHDRDVGFFDAVKRLGSTTALFYGHDHRNNAAVLYDDVLFCYALKTGITVYFESDSLGGNLITVHSDSTYELDRIFYEIF